MVFWEFSSTPQKQRQFFSSRNAVENGFDHCTWKQQFLVPIFWYSKFLLSNVLPKMVFWVPFFGKNHGKTRQGRKAGGLQAAPNLHLAISGCFLVFSWTTLGFLWIFPPCLSARCFARAKSKSMQKRLIFALYILRNPHFSNWKPHPPEDWRWWRNTKKKKYKYFMDIFAFLKLIQLRKGMSGKRMKNPQQLQQNFQITKITKVSCGRGVGTNILDLAS